MAIEKIPDILKRMNFEAAPDRTSFVPFHPKARLILEKYLLPGETLIWCDKPQMRPGKTLLKLWPWSGLILIVFVFMLSNFMAQNARILPQVEPEAIHQASPVHGKKAPLAVMIAGSAFVSLFFGLWGYVMFRGLGGQKLLNLFSSSKTWYGLTPIRLIMVSGRKEYRVLSYHLLTAQNLRLQEEPDGIGTIYLGPKEQSTNPFLPDEVPPLVLKNIFQPAQVFRVIVETQDKLLQRRQA